MTDHEDEEDPGEYVRTKADIQLGAGVDRRGSIEFEMRQHLPDLDECATTNVQIPLGATDRQGPDALLIKDVPRDDEGFARVVLELDRRVELLRNTLGLDDDDK